MHCEELEGEKNEKRWFSMFRDAGDVVLNNGNKAGRKILRIYENRRNRGRTTKDRKCYFRFPLPHHVFVLLTD